MSQSVTTSVAKASALMAGLLLLSRILGQLRDTVISWRFGSDELVDAYRAAFQVPDLLFFLVAGGALSSAFIPVFTGLWAKGEEDDAWDVFGILATFMGIAVGVLIIVAWIFAPQLVSIMTPDLPEQTKPLAVHMARILLPAQIGFFLGGLMFGTMNARQHFTVPGLSPNIYNVGIICGALFIAPMLAIGIFGLAWGAVIGATTGTLIVPILFLRKFGVRFRPSLRLSHPGVKEVFKLMLPVVLGLSLPGIYAIVMRGFASGYAPGVLNDLEISNRIMQAPLGILGQAFAIAVFPTLSALYAQNRPEEFLATLSKTLRSALFLGIYISAALFVFAEDIVRVLNQYGAFTEEHTQIAAAGLQMFSFGVFAWCGHPVLMRAFFAMKDTLTPVVLGTLVSGVFIGLVYAFTHPSALAMGYRGLPLAISVSAILLLMLLIAGLRRRLGRVDGSRLARLLGVGTLAATACGVALYYTGGLIPVGEGLMANFWSAAKLLVLGLAGLWAYLGLSRLGGLTDEVRYTMAGFRGRQSLE